MRVLVLQDQTGVVREDVFLPVLGSNQRYLPDVHTPVGVFRFMGPG